MRLIWRCASITWTCHLTSLEQGKEVQPKQTSGLDMAEAAQDLPYGSVLRILVIEEHMKAASILGLQEKSKIKQRNQFQKCEWISLNIVEQQAIANPKKENWFAGHPHPNPWPTTTKQNPNKTSTPWPLTLQGTLCHGLPAAWIVESHTEVGTWRLVRVRLGSFHPGGFCASWKATNYFAVFRSQVMRMLLMLKLIDALVFLLFFFSLLFLLLLLLEVVQSSPSLHVRVAEGWGEPHRGAKLLRQKCWSSASTTSSRGGRGPNKKPTNQSKYSFLWKARSPRPRSCWHQEALLVCLHSKQSTVVN